MPGEIVGCECRVCVVEVPKMQADRARWEAAAEKWKAAAEKFAEAWQLLDPEHPGSCDSRNADWSKPKQPNGLPSAVGPCNCGYVELEAAVAFYQTLSEGKVP